MIMKKTTTMTNERPHYERTRVLVCVGRRREPCRSPSVPRIRLHAYTWPSTASRLTMAAHTSATTVSSDAIESSQVESNVALYMHITADVKKPQSPYVSCHSTVFLLISFFPCDPCLPTSSPFRSGMRFGQCHLLARLFVRPQSSPSLVENAARDVSPSGLERPTVSNANRLLAEQANTEMEQHRALTGLKSSIRRQTLLSLQGTDDSVHTTEVSGSTNTRPVHTRQ